MKKCRPKLARSTWKRRANRTTSSENRPHRYQYGRLVSSAWRHVASVCASRCCARYACALETSPSSDQNPNQRSPGRVTLTPLGSSTLQLLRQLRVPDAVQEVDEHADHEPDDQPLPRGPSEVRHQVERR